MNNQIKAERVVQEAFKKYVNLGGSEMESVVNNVKAILDAPEAPTKHQKRVIITSYTQNIKAACEPFIENQREYSKQWGYDYFNIGEAPVGWEKIEPVYWKIRFVKDFLNMGYEQVLWLDADVAFTNFTRDIGELIGDHWLAGLREVDKWHPKYICSGILLFSNCEQSVKCLDHIIGRIEAGDHCGIVGQQEQNQLNQYLTTIDYGGVKACSENELGGVCDEIGNGSNLRAWKYGDLTIHIPLMPWANRGQLLVGKYNHKIVREKLITAEPGELLPERPEFDSETIKQMKLYIAVPCYGGKVSMITSASLMRFGDELHKAGVSYAINMMTGEMVARARNRLADAFMDSDFTHLMFIDSDIGFDAEDTIKMLKTNLHVIGGVYPLKDYKWDKLKDMALPEGNEQPDILDYCFNGITEKAVDADGKVHNATRTLRDAIEAHDIGTGFLVVSREALQRFRDAYPKFSYADDFANTYGKRITLFFNYDIVDDRYVSEDFWLCDYWRKLGGKVWAWPWVNLQHEGSNVFTSSFERRVRPVKKEIKAIALTT